MTEGKSGKGAGRIVVICLIMVATVAVGIGIGVAAYYPSQTVQMLRGLTGAAATEKTPVAEPEPADADDAVEDDAADDAAASVEAADDDQVTTRQIAAFGDICIYSPITQNVLTGVLFHQASYETGLVMTTELPAVSEEGIGVDNPVRVNNQQTEGDWVDADALHLYRETDNTQMDTSIDVGAPWGSTVYAPVTGTVVLVKDYDLYGYVPDVQIHIQPDGHPELDLVLLHQYDPLVKAGDHVEGGVTPLSHVRDIAADLTDIQLGFYTKADDPGNHSHVQLNNADFPGYREESLKDAYQVQ